MGLNAGSPGLNVGSPGLNAGSPGWIPARWAEAYDAFDDAWVAGVQSTGSCFALVVATWPALAPAPVPLVLVGDPVGVGLMVIVGVGVALWVGVGEGEVDGAVAVGLGVARGDEQLGAGTTLAGLPVVDVGVAWPLGATTPDELVVAAGALGWVAAGPVIWFVGVMNCCAWPSANTPATTMPTAAATAMTGLSQEAAGPSRMNRGPSRVKAGASRARSPVGEGWIRCAAARRCRAVFQPVAASNGGAQATSGRSRARAVRSQPSTCPLRAGNCIRVARASSRERAPAVPDSSQGRMGRNQSRNSASSTKGPARRALTRPRIRSRPSAAGSIDSAAARSARRRMSS